MDVNSDNALRELKQIETMVRRVVKGQVLDVEQLAVDIWVELWLGKQKHATRWFVKMRCLDAFRKQVRELKTSELTRSLEAPERVDLEAGVDVVELVNKLMALVRDARQRRVVYLRFYRGMTFDAIGREVGLGKEAVRLELRGVLDRLRLEAERQGLEYENA